MEETNKFILQRRFCLSNWSLFGSKCFGANNNCYVVSKHHPTTITFLIFDSGDGDKFTLYEYDLTTDTHTDKKKIYYCIKSEGKEHYLTDIQLSICPFEPTNHKSNNTLLFIAVVWDYDGNTNYLAMNTISLEDTQWGLRMLPLKQGDM